MLLAMKIKAAITAAVLASPIALTVAPVAHPVDSAITEIAAKPFQYRLAGDFSRDGKPAPAPLREALLAASIKIMNRQVTAGEYARCADDGRCPKIPQASAMAERPMVGVSWRDATAYAEWMTNKTGVLHRLPTDEEWVFAAGQKVREEALPLVDPVDPAQAWIARYEAEANRARPGALDPQPVGAFGRNENGLLDVGGNIWEWTNSCFLRMTLEPTGAARVTNTNCGVRVVQGAHRTYMTDFIRDPRTGGCAAGVPPANLGFRLVVEDKNWPALQRMIVATFTPG
ncbi:SUMF1/EgtB/PvdO family nonheme iron enzyme [Bradyrhizobium sp. JYMT SZCCT0428]|uniref:SUMF1/EgtB/PvdO family nonheme iron enzyme n=1 Tax=Bradyrhizobium sp. JYMT SZCCT0428 TaxID=2807673 RepID=UPI001BABE4D7|nr:SUMF1/EgtB/PvdO family nonheme iron enzyme [Bradyrhizobium sp. JYMT SZCCT0428]MBR1155564.1 SUMF1/EgtB/PvdO family nonheme iron enzyme [Bradyrhizobium sp. JYMT SZCCT0428]